MSLRGQPAVFRYDLGVARNRVLIQTQGKRIKAINASSPNALLEVAIQESLGSVFFQFRKGAVASDYADGFTQFYLKNKAQAGEWIELMITGGGDDFDFDDGQQNTIDSIANPIQFFGGNLRSTSAASIGTTAAQILAANADRMGFTVYNNGAATVFIGTDASVTTSNGYPLGAGESFSSQDRDALFGITASGTVDVRSMEIERS